MIQTIQDGSKADKSALTDIDTSWILSVNIDDRFITVATTSQKMVMQLTTFISTITLLSIRHAWTIQKLT